MQPLTGLWIGKGRFPLQDESGKDDQDRKASGQVRVCRTRIG